MKLRELKRPSVVHDIVVPGVIHLTWRASLRDAMGRSYVCDVVHDDDKTCQVCYCSLKEDWRHGFTWKVGGQMEKLWLAIYFLKGFMSGHDDAAHMNLESWAGSLLDWSDEQRTTTQKTIPGHYARGHDFLPVGDNRLQYRSGHLQRFLHCGAHRVSCDDVQLPEPLMRVWTGGEWSSGRIYGDETSKIKTDIL